MNYIDSARILKSTNAYPTIKSGLDAIYNLLSEEKLNPTIEDVKKVYSSPEYIRTLFEAMKAKDIEVAAPIDRDIIKKQIDSRVNDLIPKIPTKIHDNAILIGDWVIKSNGFIIPNLDKYLKDKFTTKLNKEQIKAVDLLNDMIDRVNKVDAYFKRKNTLSDAVYKTRIPCVDMTGEVDLWEIIRQVK